MTPTTTMASQQRGYPPANAAERIADAAALRISAIVSGLPSSTDPKARYQELYSFLRSSMADGRYHNGRRRSGWCLVYDRQSVASVFTEIAHQNWRIRAWSHSMNAKSENCQLLLNPVSANAVVRAIYYHRDMHRPLKDRILPPPCPVKVPGGYAHRYVFHSRVSIRPSTGLGYEEYYAPDGDHPDGELWTT